MTSLPTAYTPLETLLLFQALRSEGVNTYSVFNRISDQLKKIPLVRSHPTYDSGRLSPDALRELCLWLLKEEAKSDLQRQSERETLLQNGELSPGSRKRKAPSPAFPTVNDASKHAHLIPQLVTRLYARYREFTVREIREHERRYEALSHEIAEIETGKREHKLKDQKPASGTQSPRPSSSTDVQLGGGPDGSVHTSKATSTSPVSPLGTSDGNAVKTYTQNKIDALINHESDAANGATTHRRNSSNTTLPPLSEMAPQSPRFGIPPKIPGPIPPQMQGHGYTHSPTSNQQSPFPHNHAHPAQASLSRPSSSSSPRPVLPPPKGMQFPSPSPGQHPNASNLHGPPLPQQHYPPQPPPHGLQTAPSPTNDRPQLGYPHPQPSTVAGYYPHQPYLERRTSYPPIQQQSPPGYPNQAVYSGSYPIPPYGGDSQDLLNGQAGQQFLQQSANPAHGPPTYPHPATAPSTTSRPERPPNTRMVSDIINALATPPRQPIWKSERRPPPIKVGTELPPPDPEPLSPVLKRSEPAARSTRSTRNRGGTLSEQLEGLEALPMPTRTRGKPRRDRSPHSVVSSTADESARMTRSHSVSTTAGVLPTSDDRPESRDHVKAEPSTPAAFGDDTDTPHDPTSGGRMTRKRRGTLQSLPQPPHKRRREQSASAQGEHDLEEAGTTPPPRSTKILATRNFHKLCGTIMNDINSHKHASYFAKEVREKDAPGYGEIIKFPQNLKSIRAAINAGTRAMNAATAALDSPSTTVGTPTSTSRAGANAAESSAATVELDRAEDLIPPKGIVNAAQLEKEVMRMFANAVLFNPGEDGMVRDTREMFEEVEAKMREWRGAENAGEDGTAGGGAGGAGGGGEEDGKVKRRKV